MINPNTYPNQGPCSKCGKPIGYFMLRICDACTAALQAEGRCPACGGHSVNGECIPSGIKDTTPITEIEENVRKFKGAP